MGIFKSMRKAFGTEKAGGKRSPKPKGAAVRVDLIESPRQTQTANRPALKKGFDFEDSVLMLSYADKFGNGKNEFQGFWEYKYGIGNPQAILKQLERDGLIEVGGLADALQKLTAADLKEELKADGLPVSGKKADLHHRLCAEGDIGRLERKYPKRFYRLTQTGRSVLDANPHIRYIHAHPEYDIDVKTLQKMMLENPGYGYRDMIWRHLNEASLRNFRLPEVGLYRNTRLNMAHFLMEENRVEGALFHLVEVVYLDLCGQHGDYIQYAEKKDFEYGGHLYTVAPGIIDLLKAYQSKLGWDKEKYLAKIDETIDRMSIPSVRFSKEGMKQIVRCELAGDISTLKQIYQYKG